MQISIYSQQWVLKKDVTQKIYKKIKKFFVFFPDSLDGCDDKSVPAGSGSWLVEALSDFGSAGSDSAAAGSESEITGTEAADTNRKAGIHRLLSLCFYQEQQKYKNWAERLKSVNENTNSLQVAWA